MKENDIQFVFIDDDIDEHYLLRKDFTRYAPTIDLLCFESWDAFQQFMHENNDILKKRTVMLLDLNMPGVSGYDVIERVRQDERYKMLPIVVYSTSKSEQDVKRGYELGANSFITKPTDREEAAQLTKSLAQYWTRCVQLPSAEVDIG